MNCKKEHLLDLYFEMKNSERRYLLRTEINSFHYLYQDADYLMSAAKLPQMEGTFEAQRLSRSALLLYILSLEALVNRALDHFTPAPLHDFLIDREEKFNTVDKWRLLGLTAADQKVEIDTGVYPWSHLTELFKIRNEYVHPKHDRMAYYEMKAVDRWEHLDWNNIPADCGLKEKDLIYVQTKLPRDPYGIGVQHLETVKRVVDDTVAELDNILDGKLTESNWLRSDQMHLFHPAGASFDDFGQTPIQPEIKKV